jgi:hypothetical protein
MSYRAVYKFPMEGPALRVKMDPGAQILTVETQNGLPTIWALVMLHEALDCRGKHPASREDQ